MLSAEPECGNVDESAPVVPTFRYERGWGLGPRAADRGENSPGARGRRDVPSRMRWRDLRVHRGCPLRLPAQDALTFH